MIGVGSSVKNSGASSALSIPYTVSGSTPKLVVDFTREIYKVDS